MNGASIFPVLEFIRCKQSDLSTHVEEIVERQHEKYEREIKNLKKKKKFLCLQIPLQIFVTDVSRISSSNCGDGEIGGAADSADCHPHIQRHDGTRRHRALQCVAVIAEREYSVCEPQQGTLQRPCTGHGGDRKL